MTGIRVSLCLLAAASMAMAADRATLTGNVVDSAGKPVEHATVLVYKAGVKVGYSTYCPTCYSDCGKHVSTDAAGAFTIGNLSPDLKFELLVVGDGYVSAFVKSVDPAKGPAKTAVLKSKPPVTDPSRIVRGKVVDAGGRPLRDAVVRPLGILAEDPKYGRTAMYGTVSSLDPIEVTNDKGEFELSYDRAVLQTLIVVEARGMAAKLFNHLASGLDRHTLTVTDGAVLRGRLVEDGKPVAGAEIGLVPRERGGGAELKMFGSLYDEIRIGTQPDGTFVITNVPPEVEWYVYGKMGSLAGRGATGTLECATKTDEEDVNVGDIQVRPGYKLRGKVVLSDGKEIASGMRVTINTSRGFDSQTKVLQPDGSFEFGGLAPGKYEVFASVRGYRAPEWDYRSKTERPGTVELDHGIDGFVLAMEKIQ